MAPTVRIFSGSSHPTLTKLVCERLQLEVSKASLSKFSNLETNIKIGEEVRGNDVYIIQSAVGNANDVLMELIFMIASLKHRQASRVTAVVPLLPYAGMAKHTIKMLSVAGADRIITMELNTFFTIPTDNLSAEPAMLKHIKDAIPEWQNSVIVAPDSAKVRRAASIGDQLGVRHAFLTAVKKTPLVGEVAGAVAILVDDVADEAICTAADRLVEAGAEKVYAFCVHGIFSEPALQLLNASKFEAVGVTNTIPQDENMKRCSKIQCIDISMILADAIREAM